MAIVYDIAGKRVEFALTLGACRRIERELGKPLSEIGLSESMETVYALIYNCQSALTRDELYEWLDGQHVAVAGEMFSALVSDGKPEGGDAKSGER